MPLMVPAGWQINKLVDFRLIFAHTVVVMAITKRQRQVYDFIAEFVRDNGYSPSFEEIGEGLGLNSLATVHKHVSNLEKKGLLKRDFNRSRSIDVLPPKGRMKQAIIASDTLPLVGRIAAGSPIEAISNPETISLADFSRSRDVFVLEAYEWPGNVRELKHVMERAIILAGDDDVIGARHILIMSPDN